MIRYEIYYNNEAGWVCEMFDEKNRIIYTQQGETPEEALLKCRKE